MPGMAAGHLRSPGPHGSGGVMLPHPCCQQRALAVRCTSVVWDRTMQLGKLPSLPSTPGQCWCDSTELQDVKDTLDAALARTNDEKPNSPWNSVSTRINFHPSINDQNLFFTSWKKPRALGSLPTPCDNSKALAKDPDSQPRKSHVTNREIKVVT